MVTRDQWLELHRLCLDTIRAGIAGVPDDQMVAEPLLGDGSIGDQANHVIGAEVYWLREVRFEPEFRTLDRRSWTEAGFREQFAKIERQYEGLLGDRGLDRDLLFGLSRVCQHALYHSARIVALRCALEPGWEPTQPLRWERAVDFITDLLLVGPEAKPRYD